MNNPTPEKVVTADGTHIAAQFFAPAGTSVGAILIVPAMGTSQRYYAPFSDDELMSARNTESMHGFYVNAPRTMKRFTPQSLGLARIGHFGFFRAEFENSLWRRHLLPELHP